MSAFHDESSHSVYRILQRLLQYSRASVPAIMARRSIGSFTLQEEPAPEQATNYRFVMVYPQNPFVGEAEVRRMFAGDIQPGLMNARVQIQDSRGVMVMPDADGHYLYPEDTPEFDCLNAFYYTTFTLRMFERYAGRAIPWAFNSPRITIDPHVGNRANAFYNEQEGVLGFHTYDAGGVERSTARSADVVSHEAGHAVLDGLRDLYNESFGLGCRAFHESFGDIAAILVAMHDDALIRRLLDMTKGNLRMSSFVTEVAEQVTAVLKAGNNHILAKSVYLRNAFNRLKAVPFDTLKYAVEDGEFHLSRQEHNYSRLFTGAFYDILVGIYELLRKANPPAIALFRARETMGRLLMSAIEMGPVGELDFSDMARALLTADSLLLSGRYQDGIRAIFAERGILAVDAAETHLAGLAALPDIRLPRMLNNSQAAATFLQETVLPALKLNFAGDIIPMNAYRNAYHFQFINYFIPHQITLQGSEFGQHQGTVIDCFGGLTLTFDSGDKLRSAFLRPVTAEDVRQINIILAEMIQQGRLTSSLHPVNTVPEPHPKGLMLRDADGGRLVKYPVVYDDVPQQIQGFMSFLDAWEQGGGVPGE